MSYFPDEKDKLQTLFHTLDTLDTERTDYMGAAENYAGRPPPNGVYEWSPSLENKDKTVTYWKIRLSNSRANVVQSPRALNLKRELRIEDTDSDCNKYILGQLKGTWKELRMVQRNSKERRESHLQDLAEHYANRRNTTKTTEVNKIKI